jgi:hypothetical protein
MMSDLIYHPTHNHFHVTDFANYALFKKNTSGVYRNTTRKGSKTSFCILDSIKVEETATDAPEYTDCNAKRQGLSAGWGDIYTSGLPDQWIDLGTRMIADGDYAIHTTADPYNRIKEANEGNNTATTLFTIKNGKLAGGASTAPYCAAKPLTVKVGGTVYVVCDRLPPGATVSIRWWTETSAPVATATVTEEGQLEASYLMPPTTRGAHYVYISDPVSSLTVRAVVDTGASFVVDPSTGPVGKTIAFSLAGFSAGEKVTVTYQQSTAINVTVATVTADGKGNASGTAVVPSSAAGAHTFSAVGGSGAAPVTDRFTVSPELRLQPTIAAAGGKVRPWLRGFSSRDLVTLKIQETGALLGTVSVSNTGAANPSLGTELTLPKNLPPGVYHIQGIGSKSGATAVAELTITAVTPSQNTPSPTATPTFTPTATATTPPSPTATASATPTPTATPEPTLTPSPTATLEAQTTPAETSPTPDPTS